jgi:hypothetical protein
MEIARARFLVSEAGRTALSGLGPELRDLDVVQLAARLRKRFAPEEASALAEQVTLAARATERGSGRPGFLYTPAGLEMMTHPLVAARRAKRLADLGLPFADLTMGLGGDLGAVTARGVTSVGLDREAATVLLGAANVPGAGVVRGDATRLPFDVSGRAILLDPSRRESGRRTFDPAAFSPPWDVCLALAAQAKAAVIKAPPGLDHRAVPAEAELEFVEVGRGLREAALWLGQGATAGLRRAVRADSGDELTSEAAEAPFGGGPAGRFLFDPRSCVTRAGLVRHLAARIGAHQLDPQVAYLASDDAVTDPLADTFEVVDVAPFAVNRLRDRLRAGHWRPDEIRRRAFPIEPDELRRLLGPLEGERVALVCTTIAGQRTVFIARPVKRAR